MPSDEAGERRASVEAASAATDDNELWERSLADSSLKTCPRTNDGLGVDSISPIKSLILCLQTRLGALDLFLRREVLLGVVSEALASLDRDKRGGVDVAAIDSKSIA